MRLVLVLAAIAVGVAGLAAMVRGVTFAAVTEDRTASLEAFRRLAPVLQHPRCMNCHPRGDSPTQSDRMVAHLPPVKRGPDGRGQGLRCGVCHGAKNNDAIGAPGAPDWHLAPLGMGWQGLTVPQICASLTDKRINGGRAPAAIAEHLATDALVAWAWKPGVHPGGRARSQPPVSHREFGAAARRWAATGAHCPTEAGAARKTSN